MESPSPPPGDPGGNLPAPVDLAAYTPQLVVWSTFNISAAWANLALLVVSLCIRRLRTRYLLLALHTAFFLTCGSGSMLVWTGQAMAQYPTPGVCRFNAAAVVANVPIQAGAALGLVMKVWTNAMQVYYPNMRILGFMGSTWLLLVFPHLASLPLFIIALVRGERDPTSVRRTSPFYCTHSSTALGDAASFLGATFTFIALVCAGWTAVYVARSHWRVRSLGSRGGRTNYQLVLRVLFFSVFVGVAFVCGIVSLMSSFSAVAQDVVLSITGLAAFFIFASDKDIIAFVRCRPLLDSRTPSANVSTLSFAPPNRSRRGATTTLIDHVQGAPTQYESGAELATLSHTALSKDEGEAVPDESHKINRLAMSDFGDVKGADSFEEERDKERVKGGAPDEVDFWHGEERESEEEEDKRYHAERAV